MTPLNLVICHINLKVLLFEDAELKTTLALEDLVR